MVLASYWVVFWIVSGDFGPFLVLVKTERLDVLIFAPKFTSY